MNTKWLWIGQRFSDGLLYSRALSGLDVFFSCDGFVGEMPTSLNSYSLPITNAPSKWTSSHIQSVVKKYAVNINDYISKGYNVFPYFISDDVRVEIYNANSLFNRRVFSNQLSRSVQMYLMASAGIKTPRWTVPKASTWSDLTSMLGIPLILQFDNTSSGLGTYCIASESAYNKFCKRHGEADIATEYIDSALSCSAHVFITAKKVVVSSPSVQIIEHGKFEPMTDINTFSFMGNDFSFYASNVRKNNEVIQVLQKIGKVYQNAGIFGLLGVDFLIKEDVFFYNETNFRLQNSTSLLSFLQPIGNGNIVQCLTTEPKEFSEVTEGYQYFAKAPVLNISSGYYSTDGYRLADAFSKEYYKQGDTVLIFSDNYTPKEQSLRIVGFNRCLNSDGKVGIHIQNFIEKLVRMHEHTGE